MFHQLLCVAMYLQDPPPQNDLQMLIQEVRTLRAALDRTTFIGLRVQLVLHRLGQQQQVVTRLDNVRLSAEGRVSGMKAQRDRMEFAAREAEQQRSKDPRMEGMLRDFKSELEAAPKRQQEAELALIEAQQNLRSEQIKLDDLQRQLDELERQLAQLSK